MLREQRTTSVKRLLNGVNVSGERRRRKQTKLGHWWLIRLIRFLSLNPGSLTDLKHLENFTKDRW